MVLKHHCTIDSPAPGHDKYSPLFQSLCYAPFGFHERPTLLPVFANRKKSEDFHFYGKIKSEIAFSVFFSKPFYRGSVHQSNESGPHQAPFLGTTLTFLAPSHLHFILIYFVHPLATCVLMYQKSLREDIFWGSGNVQHFFPYKLMVNISSLYAILA